MLIRFTSHEVGFALLISSGKLVVNEHHVFSEDASVKKRQLTNTDKSLYSSLQCRYLLCTAVVRVLRDSLVLKTIVYVYNSLRRGQDVLM